MKRHYRYAYNALKKMGVPIFIHRDDENRFDISAEDTNSSEWVNYWDHPEGWPFGVHPKIDDVLSQRGLHAEWINPGHLRVFD
jgi:hypothetical protein